MFLRDSDRSRRTFVPRCTAPLPPRFFFFYNCTLARGSVPLLFLHLIVPAVLLRSPTSPSHAVPWNFTTFSQSSPRFGWVTFLGPLFSPQESFPFPSRFFFHNYLESCNSSSPHNSSFSGLLDCPCDGPGA